MFNCLRIPICGSQVGMNTWRGKKKTGSVVKCCQNKNAKFNIAPPGTEMFEIIKKFLSP